MLSACSSLPNGASKIDSQAISGWDETHLGITVSQALPADGRSGFRLQPYGPNAFATRIALARLATRSLDVQYFLLTADNTGLVLLRELRDAAARGVRVRLLLDDFNTVGEDELLLALSSYPNVQVRLFNPFASGRWSIWSRFTASAFDFHRLNRRMHNKLFVADNAAAVTGGRNVADEYAMNNLTTNFLDMDLFVAGPMVRDLSTAFDHYWNSAVVYDIARVVQVDMNREHLQEAFGRRTEDALPPSADPNTGEMVIGHTTDEPLESASARAGMLNLASELVNDRLSPLVLATGRVLFDSVSKTQDSGDGDGKSFTVTQAVVKWMHSARNRVKMISPYFVPDNAGMEAITGASKAGLEMTLITNSLASTDIPWAYLAYWRRLDELLRAGVSVTEISPSLIARRNRLGASSDQVESKQLLALALHMKTVIVDDRQVFLGSMNLDRRSANLNSEVGVIIDSPELVRQINRFIEATRWYRLRLSSTRNIEWVEDTGEHSQKIYDVPPETTAWTRLLLRLASPLVSEEAL